MTPNFNFRTDFVVGTHIDTHTDTHTHTCTGPDPDLKSDRCIYYKSERQRR